MTLDYFLKMISHWVTGLNFSSYFMKLSYVSPYRIIGAVLASGMYLLLTFGRAILLRYKLFVGVIAIKCTLKDFLVFPTACHLSP